MPLDGDKFIRETLFTTQLSEISGSCIGVEATEYLKQMIEISAHEPLLAALGGAPIGLKHHLEAELDRWTENNIKPLFVFEGQSTVGKDDIALRNAKEALDRTENAWKLYINGEPDKAVTAFGNSHAVRAQDLYPILQEVLDERGLEYLIAPFSACAQLAYLESLPEPYIDGIMGSQELLLYDIDDAVINPPSASDWEKRVFSGHVKSELIKKLNVTPEVLADTLLMVGTSFLPTFPPLLDESIIKQPFTIQSAANLLRTSEKSVSATCVAFSDILQRYDPNWQDKYRKAKMSIKHCCIVKDDGSLHIRNFETLTDDNSAYLGLQLPAELYHYLSKALIGPRLLNPFVHVYFVSTGHPESTDHLESTEFPTLDGVVSDEYRELVTKSLLPTKEVTAALISSRIHRTFIHKKIITKFWFDPNINVALAHRDAIEPTNQKTGKWGVRDSVLKLKANATSTTPGTFSFAVSTLQDKEFVAKSILSNFSLETRAEVAANAIYRLLHLRGYVNDQHELTSWGKALGATLKAIQPAIKKHGDVHRIEQAAFLAYELVRFDNLNARNRHTELIGGTLRGSDEDKESCILIGRTACLLKLRHKNIGYTGPLSKNFLSYYSIIKAVREADRDLLEAIAASMFLGNQASRKLPDTDYAVLGRSLPLGADVNVGLGIAVKTYLDDWLKLDTPPDQRAASKSEYAEKYLPNNVNFEEDLDVAFDFFDALYEGIKTLGGDIPENDKKAWDGAKVYLGKRR